MHHPANENNKWLRLASQRQGDKNVVAELEKCKMEKKKKEVTPDSIKCLL